MPSCIPIKSESDGNVILAWAIALLLLACLLGLKKKR
jgi:LPXTG-motif cell wall-anchored protein